MWERNKSFKEVLDSITKEEILEISKKITENNEKYVTDFVLRVSSILMKTKSNSEIKVIMIESDQLNLIRNMKNIVSELLNLWFIIKDKEEFIKDFHKYAFFTLQKWLSNKGLINPEMILNKK